MERKKNEANEEKNGKEALRETLRKRQFVCVREREKRREKNMEQKEI